MTPAKIFPFRKPLAQPRLRMLCFPYAGGAAALYRAWPSLLAPAIDVCPVELPGRGVRTLESPIRAMAPLCDSLAAAIAPLLDVPTAVFGHSMGARIAFEIALRFPRQIIHVFASGSPPPGARPRFTQLTDRRPTIELTDRELTQRLRELGGTPPEIIDDTTLMARLLPAVRADFELIEAYRGTPSDRLACPITVFAGLDDAGASPAVAAGWELRTTARCRLLELEAGHFFLDTHRDALVRQIAHDLAPHLA